MKTWILILLMTWPALCGAAVYKWVDELGHVHYGNVPPRLQEEYKEGNDQTVPVYQQTSPRATNKPTPKPAPATPVESAVSEPAASEPVASEPGLSTEERMRQVHERIMHTLQSTPLGRQLLEQNTGEKSAVEKAAMPAEQTPEKTPAEKAETETPAPKSESPQTETQQKTAPPESTEPATTAPSEVDEDYAVDIPASEEKMATAADTDSSETKASGESEQAESGDPQQHAAQMCGVFTGYVEDYKLRIKNECSGDLCDIYRRQLEKYRKKQQQYCGQLAK